MKRINYYILFLLCCLSLGAYGQNPSVCNYIMSRTYTKANGLENRANIDYYDGLGRLSGTTLVGAAPSGKDIVTRKDYNTLGRLWREWLPRTSEHSNGKQLTPVEFASLSAGGYDNDSHTYSKTIYENSPLDRIIEQYGPGTDWYDNGKSATTTYQTNISGNLALNCKFYHIGGFHQHPALDKNSNYATGELYVTEMKNEDGNTSYEFKDKLGQVILNRQMAGDTTYDTYYVYDDFGMLCFVLPPLMDEEEITQTKLDELAYQYKYDVRHRCIAKKLPGCEWVYYIYDKADRLIFSQDGNRRQAGEWMFSIPDIFGKECISGICSNSFDAFSAPLDSVVVKAERQSTPSSAAGDATGDISNLGYRLSGVSLISPTILRANYYNDYSFPGRNGIPAETDADLCYDTDAESEGFGRYYAASAQGLLTGTVTAQISSGKVAPSTDYLYSIMYYDNHGRVVQTKSGNHLTGGTEKEYVAYDFIGQTTQRKHVHSATGKMTQTEVYTHTYDPAGRLLTTTHQLNNGKKTTLIDNVYDELGRLASNRRNGQFNLKTDYTYNVRSWMKSITGSLFAQTLHYTDGIGTPCYGGNISSMNWKTGTEPDIHGYRFEYDPLSRLTNAVYGEDQDLSLNTSRFNEQITSYDKNGNILGLKRYGQTSANGYGLVDNLAITLNGNQLKRVDDSVSGSAFGDHFDFKDGAKQSTEYFYDTNGNLLKDLNKKIINIQYNYLNLPNRIEFEDGSSISYLYDATGTKLRVVHSIAGNTTTTDYCGKVIYENGTPKTLLTEAGFVSLNDKKYHYYLQDHQGNNRVIADQAGAVEEVNHYYPFGGIFASTSSVQPYKYNGKELDRKGGLDWYDYGARMYDAALGRWHAVDPMADKYYGISPYNYCLNNPFRLIDPNGMWPGDPLLQPFGRYQYGSNAALNTLKFIHNTVASAVNTPIYMINGLADETQYIYNSGVGSYLSSGTKNIGDAVSSELSYRINTPVSQQASDTWKAMKDPENWENATATAVLMLGPMKKVSSTLKGSASVVSTGTEATTVVKVHGNSLKSQRPTWGYKLYSTDGTFLKNGITSQIIPEKRYTKSFMEDKRMEPIELFPNRQNAWDWEYQENLINRGPLNKNMH